MKKNKGFTLIEVLLSLIILTVAIVSVNAAFKQFVEYKSKMEKYKKIYITTLSIKDMIENKTLNNGETGIGELNGLKYKYNVELIASGRNITGDMEIPGQLGQGSFELYLYKITLYIDNKKYEFYKMQYKKLKNMEIPYGL